MEEELMAREIEADMEEEGDIEPIVDDPNIHSEPPLIGSHLPFKEMIVVPPHDDMVTDI